MDVRSHKDGATMRITDNGRGFTQGRSAKHAASGLGLRNMQERIEQLNGTLRIQSSANGTIIEAQVPLAQVLNADAVDETRERKAS